MNGNEKVGIIPAGYHRSFMQTDKDVAASGVYDLHIRICLLDLLAKQLGYSKNNMLLMHVLCLSEGSRILSAMTGIYYYRLQSQMP